MTNEAYRAENMPKYKQIFRWLWMLWGLGVLALAIFFIALSYSSDLPSTEELQNPENNLATEVLATDGTVIGRYFVENRVSVRYDELPDNLVNALISTEDRRYLNHAGVDLEALARVAKGLVAGTTDQGGGSTITQQLAKMQYSNRSLSGSFLQKAYKLGLIKFKEWITAVQLERRYTKEEILSMYLNEFDFLYGAVGIKSAAETYFGKPQQDLKVEESALLVGMLKNPSLYNPKRFPENARKRREVVLKLMMDDGHFDRETYDSLRQLPIQLAFFRATHSEGHAPYFREELRAEVKRILAKKSEEGVNYNVHTDGLKIYTTLDLGMQSHAEAAVRKNMASHQKKFFKEWKGKDPWTYGNMTDEQREMRQHALTKVVRESDRYATHRNNIMAESLSAVHSGFGLMLKDYDIERMLAEERKNGYLATLVKSNLLDGEKSKTYRKIMRSSAWKTLKRDWRNLQRVVEKDFATETEMTVFAYNDRMETDTVMTPMDSIRYLRMHLQTGVMAIDPRSGAIKAWVGGINHKYFKFDHVNRNVERQVGSTFKPFVYAVAIEQGGISPCYKVADIAYTIHKGEGCFGLIKDWTPKNFGKYTGREFSLYEGLKKSKNTVSAYLMKQLGCPEQVRNLARQMGIDVDKKNVYGEPRVPKQPSIALGATDLSVYEMTGAYSTFANEGVFRKPFFIQRIENSEGGVIYEAEMFENAAALSKDANYVMVDMLRKVAQPIQHKLKSEVGGKTGTTNNHADAWFMGITPELVIGVWVGGDDRWIRFRSPHLGQGGVLARPIFVDMLKSVEKDTNIVYDSSKRFLPPPGELSIRIDCSGIQDDSGNGMTDDPNSSQNGGDFGDEIDDVESFFDDEESFDAPPPPLPRPVHAPPANDNAPSPPKPNAGNELGDGTNGNGNTAPIPSPTHPPKPPRPTLEDDSEDAEGF